MKHSLQRQCQLLLTDTVSLLCKNTFSYKSELKVQGLIGITVDDEAYIIQLDETFSSNEIQNPKPDDQDVKYICTETEPNIHSIKPELKLNEKETEISNVGYPGERKGIGKPPCTLKHTVSTVDNQLLKPKTKRDELSYQKPCELNKNSVKKSQLSTDDDS